MPSEQVVVVKRTSLQARHFNELTEDEVTVDNGYFCAAVFSVKEQQSFRLPFQRQDRPTVSFYSTPSTTSHTPKFSPFTRTSRSVEKELLTEGLRLQDQNMGNMEKYNACITAKYAKFVVKNESLVAELKALQKENKMLREVVMPLAKFAFRAPECEGIR